MPDDATLDRLERRVSEVERDLQALRERSSSAEVERAKRLLFSHLKEHTEVDPLRFAVRNNLSLESVEIALKEFDRRGWTVPVDD